VLKTAFASASQPAKQPERAAAAHKDKPTPKDKPTAPVNRAVGKEQSAPHAGAATAEERAADAQARDLVLARQLVQSSNNAAAVLEVDAAHDLLSIYDLPFFQEQEKLDRDEYLQHLMASAARGLLNSFTDILDSAELWDRLASNEGSISRGVIPFQQRMELAELIGQNLPEVLLLLDYRPPPPAEQWVDLVQNSMRCLLTASPYDASLAKNSVKARQELIFFTWRLRSLVEAAEQNLEAVRGGDEPQSGAFLDSLRAILVAARKRAIPTALAAGAEAAVAGVAGGPAGIGIAFLSGGLASLLGTATEAAATRWLGGASHADIPAMPASRVVEADLGALDGCVELMRSASGATRNDIRFIIRRGVFQTLQDAADFTVPVREFLWRWSSDLLTALDHSDDFPVGEAHQFIEQARTCLAGATVV
jgi:hypothetical protein